MPRFERRSFVAATTPGLVGAASSVGVLAAAVVAVALVLLLVCFLRPLPAATGTTPGTLAGVDSFAARFDRRSCTDRPSLELLFLVLAATGADADAADCLFVLRRPAPFTAVIPGFALAGLGAISTSSSSSSMSSSSSTRSLLDDMVVVLFWCTVLCFGV